MEKFKVYKNENLYDDFYCDIYDDLVYDAGKNEYEVDELTHILKPKKIGCAPDYLAVHMR